MYAFIRELINFASGILNFKLVIYFVTWAGIDVVWILSFHSVFLVI